MRHSSSWSSRRRRFQTGSVIPSMRLLLRPNSKADSLGTGDAAYGMMPDETRRNGYQASVIATML